MIPVNEAKQELAKLNIGRIEPDNRISSFRNEKELLSIEYQSQLLEIQRDSLKIQIKLAKEKTEV